MDYKYYCQSQAEEFARRIIPVPEKYPLRSGLPANFPAHFARLCDLMKNIYFDMAKQPDAYGLMLINLDSGDRNLIRKARNTIHRLADTLFRLSQSGEVKNHQLIVSAPAFKEAIKKAQGAVSNPVPKYELILSRLADFGFIISDFTGKPFGKNIESFTIEYPDYIDMIDTVKTYCDCWHEIKTDRGSVKIWPEEFHHHFYVFDYKITADHDKISVQQWIVDEGKYRGYTEAINDFYVAFYNYSIRYKRIKFNGDYNYKSKRIARDLQTEIGKFNLSLVLKNMDSYITEIESMPGSVKKPFTQNSCNHCNFQGATQEHCKYRRNWTLDGISHEACAHYGFRFDDFDLARVPDYWRLLELEYGLKI